jgi:23S rRNA (cytosine1962-C5)-methyltransferase
VDLLSRLPQPSERRIALRVKPAAERALRLGHPWLFDQAIRSQSHQGQAGDLAVVFDRKGRFLAVGLYDPESPIRVRVLQHGEPATIDAYWFQSRVARANNLRMPLLKTGTTGYRLLHGENDGMPGLIVDRYDNTLVLKLYSLAWVPHLLEVSKALGAVRPSLRTLLRFSRTIEEHAQDQYGLVQGEVLAGPPIEGMAHFTENGLRFAADVVQGQKTGFFFDQRENRALAAHLISTSPGLRRALNVFAYTGSFSVYAARGGAREVISLDASVPALRDAELNFELNRHLVPIARAKHQTLAGDAFGQLERLKDQARRFDVVIIDPPSFASVEAELPRAIRAYTRLASQGIHLLAPGGLLVMSSCTARLSADTFFGIVVKAAVRAGRPLQEIARTGHPIDHPVGFPEGAYLKCLFAWVP